MIEIDAVAMETQLQALNSACDLLNELCEGEEEGGSEVGRECAEAESRHRGLVGELGRLKDSLNTELAS